LSTEVLAQDLLFCVYLVVFLLYQPHLDAHLISDLISSFYPLCFLLMKLLVCPIIYPFAATYVHNHHLGIFNASFIPFTV
jgi:hypothetical protein